jgi:hypothetical protein
MSADILQKVASSMQNAKVSILHRKSAENASLRYRRKFAEYDQRVPNNEVGTWYIRQKKEIPGFSISRCKVVM